MLTVDRYNGWARLPFLLWSMIAMARRRYVEAASKLEAACKKIREVATKEEVMHCGSS